MGKSDIKLIIGLGNPGERYVNSRCNIGFKTLEVLSLNYGIDIRTKKKKSIIGRGNFEGKEIILLKPQTFAKLSGEVVLYIASFLRIHPSNIIIIMEDFSLPLGKLVVEQGSDESVHKCIGNLRKALKSKEFVCMRVGIKGEGAEGMQCEEYVKQEFSLAENMQLIDILNDVEATIRSIVHGDIKEVTEKYCI